MERWPHQIAALAATQDAHARGVRRVCVTSPTGAGKTIMAVDAIEWGLEHLGPVALYTNRRMLCEQTARVLESHGIDCGIRAAGHEPALLRDVQLIMVQTEGSRVYAKEQRSLHPAKVVIVDEAHIQKGDTIGRMLADHVEQGAFVVGYTATPVGIGGLYDELIVAGVNSELRACGALVKCVTYGPDEPDLAAIKKYRIGEDLTEAENVKVMMRPGIFGRVFDWWEKLNPDRRPAILFAPGVKESLWFCEQFNSKGIRAAHIDGDKIWLDGEFHTSTQDMRDQLKALSASGDLPIVCNRFVLREGIDWPHLYHGIFACVFGALSSFLQTGGRLLRAHPSLDHVVLQCHGGSWHRHGSLNADREWFLDNTNQMLVGGRTAALREKREVEPISCPKCAAIRLSGSICHSCGFTAGAKSRMVVQIDGSLKEMRGDINRPRRTLVKSDTQRAWDGMYWHARKKGVSFAQAEAWFQHKQNYFPPHNLGNMPVDPYDWYRSVKDVPRDRLFSDQGVLQ